MDRLPTPARSQSMRPHGGTYPQIMAHVTRSRENTAATALHPVRTVTVQVTEYARPNSTSVGGSHRGPGQTPRAPSLATCFADDRNVLREGIETLVTMAPYSRARLAGRLTAVVFRRPDA